MPTDTEAIIAACRGNGKRIGAEAANELRAIFAFGRPFL
jgi:hypothetical protein